MARQTDLAGAVVIMNGVGAVDVVQVVLPVGNGIPVWGRLGQDGASTREKGDTGNHGRESFERGTCH